MKKQEIRRLRRSSGWTQTILAELLGVHSLTVYKWEKGVLTPSSYNNALLASFQRAFVSSRDPKALGQLVADCCVSEGVPRALHMILKADFDPNPEAL